MMGTLTGKPKTTLIVQTLRDLADKLENGTAGATEFRNEIILSWSFPGKTIRIVVEAVIKEEEAKGV